MFASRTVVFRHCIIHRSSWIIVKHQYRVHSSIQTVIERRISSGRLPPLFVLFMESDTNDKYCNPQVLATTCCHDQFCSCCSAVLCCYCCCFPPRMLVVSPPDHAQSLQALLYHCSWLASYEWLSHVLNTHNVCAGRRTAWHLFQAKHLSFCVISCCTSSSSW